MLHPLWQSSLSIRDHKLCVRVCVCVRYTCVYGVHQTMSILVLVGMDHGTADSESLQPSLNLPFPNGRHNADSFYSADKKWPWAQVGTGVVVTLQQHQYQLLSNMQSSTHGIMTHTGSTLQAWPDYSATNTLWGDLGSTRYLLAWLLDVSTNVEENMGLRKMSRWGAALILFSLPVRVWSLKDS